MAKIIVLMKQKFKIVQDFSYSILASLISVAVMQLLLYPLLANIFNSNEYGQLLTVMGIVNTISSTIGNTLNNTRLIQQTRYEEKGLQGDFNLLLSYANVIGFIAIILIGNICVGFSLTVNLLLALLTILIAIKSYLVVSYRIKLNYKLNLVCSIITSIGYLIGIGVVYVTAIWPLAFIVAEVFGIIFLLFTSDLHKEPFKRTVLFNETTMKYFLLILTGLLGNLLVYMDRLIIFPVLGGESVSIYTTASVFGKSFGIVMTPIAGVLLSYFSQKSFVMTRKRFWSINLTVIFFSIGFFCVTLLLAPWVTGILYPKLIAAATPYILLANLTAVIGVTANIIQPSVLKFAPTYWQVVKEVVYGVVYLGLGYILLIQQGIIGFCWAAIIASVIRIALLCFIGTLYIKKEISLDEMG